MNIRKPAILLPGTLVTGFYIASIALMFGLSLSETAKADLLIDCSTEGELQIALSMLEFKKSTVAGNLGNKLTDGFDKVEPPMYKYCDGAQKLKDFQTTLDNLFAAGPIKAKVSDPTGGEVRACLDTGTNAFIAEWTGLAGGICEPKEPKPAPPRGPKAAKKPALW